MLVDGEKTGKIINARMEVRFAKTAFNFLEISFQKLIDIFL